MAAAKHLGAFVVVPHVDTFWIGLGRQRLAALAAPLGIDGFELLNPYHGSDASVAALLALNCRHERQHGRPLLAIGGSDAHHVEDLYRVIVEFPGGRRLTSGGRFVTERPCRAGGRSARRRRCASSFGSTPGRSCSTRPSRFEAASEG